MRPCGVVQSIANNTNLTVTSAFNRNDTTGSSVNYGPVLPYVIGRATEANVTAMWVYALARLTGRFDWTAGAK